jgi:1-acyl-sn-glycerol-3-phosphate acyltransferase
LIIQRTGSHSLPRWLALPYALWAWLTFTLLSLTALALILPLPWLSARRRVVRVAARAFLFVAAMRLNVHHTEHLGDAACVVVANHSSYLDGIVLYAALPPRFGFVIKREMSRVPLANLLLRRIGAQYVDRGQGQKGARDTRKLLKRASRGISLVFFPEGTFQPQPGLMRFRSGAFLVAARAGFPILPIVIHGTRAALPPGGLWARPGRIDVSLLAPLPPPASTGHAAVNDALHHARQRILTQLGEPDLASDSYTAQP